MTTTPTASDIAKSVLNAPIVNSQTGNTLSLQLRILDIETKVNTILSILQSGVPAGSAGGDGPIPGGDAGDDGDPQL
jgi:hypothetical protein